MGGKRDPVKGPPFHKRNFPQTLSLSNPSKAAHINHRIEQAVEHSGSQSCIHIKALAVYMVLIPPLQLLAKRVREKVMQLLFDLSLWKKLENSRVINWCLSAENLFPLWTKEDGNSLSHSVSLYLWGVHDDNLLLRHLIYKTLTERPSAEQFQTRWRKQYENSTKHDVRAQHRHHKWKMIVELASDTRECNSSNILHCKSLEEIHVFVLANIIRRPIIVLCDVVIQSIDASGLTPNCIVGIYLPTLCNPRECIKSPVILCNDNEHFVPLLSMEVPKDIKSQRHHILPIVSNNLEPLPVHFLSEEEGKRGTKLLEDYLYLTETQQPRCTQGSGVLAVAIYHQKLPEDLNLMNDFCAAVDTYVFSDKFGKTSQLDKDGLRTVNVNKEISEKQVSPYQQVSRSLRPHSDGRENYNNPYPNPHMHSSGKDMSIDPIPLAVQVQQLAQLESKPCITEGCDFHGLPENGGRCSCCVREFCRNTKATEREPKEAHHKSPLPPTGDNVQQSTKSSKSSTTPLETEESKSLSSHQEAPVEQLKCQHQGCAILASRLTFPYCKNHRFKGTIVSSVKDNRAANNGDAYYANHALPQNHDSHSENHSLESVQPVHFSKRCIVGGCNELGDSAQRNMCAPHFDDHNYSAHSKKENIKRISFAGSDEPVSQGRRINKGLKDVERSTSLRINRVLCRNRRCTNCGSPSCQGYCRDCYRRLDEIQNQQNEQEQNLMETFGHKVNKRPKSWAPNAMNTTRVELLVDLVSNTSPSSPSVNAPRAGFVNEIPPVKHRDILHVAEGEHCPQSNRSNEYVPGLRGNGPRSVRTRHMLNNALSQIAPYLEEQESLEDTSMDIRLCESPGCKGIQMKNHKYCFTCESKWSQRMCALGEIGTSFYQPLDVATFESEFIPPPLDQSSARGSPTSGESPFAEILGLQSSRPSISQGSRSEFNTSFERDMFHSPKCMFPACDNPGMGMNNGLCQECFDLLAAKRRANVQKAKRLTSIVTTTTTATTSSYLETSIVSPAASSTASCITRILCKGQGCDMYGTSTMEGFCSQCYAKSRIEVPGKHQIDQGQWLSNPTSRDDLQAKSASPSSMITARPCYNHQCYRFGDPAFNGYCSSCYDIIGSQYVHGKGIMHMPVFPQVGNSLDERELRHNDTKVSICPDRKCKVKCKNIYVSGCVNYGNPSCKGYCNSCYKWFR